MFHPMLRLTLFMLDHITYPRALARRGVGRLEVMLAMGIALMLWVWALALRNPNVAVHVHDAYAWANELMSQ